MQAHENIMKHELTYAPKSRDSIQPFALASSGHPRGVGADWRLLEHTNEAVRQAARGEEGMSLPKHDSAPPLPPLHEQIDAMTDMWPAPPHADAAEHASAA